MQQLQEEKRRLRRESRQGHSAPVIVEEKKVCRRQQSGLRGLWKSLTASVESAKGVLPGPTEVKALVPGQLEETELDLSSDESLSSRELVNSMDVGVQAEAKAGGKSVRSVRDVLFGIRNRCGRGSEAAGSGRAARGHPVLPADVRLPRTDGAPEEHRLSRAHFHQPLRLVPPTSSPTARWAAVSSL